MGPAAAWSGQLGESTCSDPRPRVGNAYPYNGRGGGKSQVNPPHLWGFIGEKLEKETPKIYPIVGYRALMIRWLHPHSPLPCLLPLHGWVLLHNGAWLACSVTMPCPWTLHIWPPLPYSMIRWTYDGLQNVSDAIGNFYAVCGAGGTTAQCGPAVPTTCNPGEGGGWVGEGEAKSDAGELVGSRTALCGPTSGSHHLQPR